jgi:hypothetical protein
MEAYASVQHTVQLGGFLIHGTSAGNIKQFSFASQARFGGSSGSAFEVG